MTTINPLNVATILQTTISQKYFNITPVTSTELELADNLLGLIETCLNSPLLYLSQLSTLCFDHHEPENEDFEEEDIDEDEPTEIPFHLRAAAASYWMSGKQKKLRWETVASKYRFITSRTQLYTMKEQVERNGTKRTKLRDIWNKTLEDFNEAMANKHAVHDMDIARWGRKHGKEVNLEGFKASGWWVLKFKRINRICSRKITRIVTSDDLKEDKLKIERANEFRNKIKELLPQYLPNHVFNSDQSGFNYEYASKRSLVYKGEKQPTVSVSSINATTHSYTIQPTTTLDGKLLTPLFICLQETDGVFGPRVKTGLFESPNVVVESRGK